MLTVINLSKQIGNFYLNNVNFKVNKGEYFVLLGPSGSGKSLLLEIIAGLQKPDQGKITLNNVNITEEKIQKRKVGIVFQDYALFPHMTVYENIIFSLSKKESKQNTIKELLKLLSIEHLLNRKPSSLSGGEKQRVALARALAAKPLLLLLDEPLASTDAMLKAEIRALLRNINKLGQTVIHVTHDYQDAITLSSKIGILNNGTLEDIGTTSEIFLKPKSLFIAKLMGIKNFFPAKIISEDENNQIKVVSIPENIEIKLVTEFSCGKEGWIIINSEDIVISLEYNKVSSNNQFKGKIVEIVPILNSIEVIIEASGIWAALVTYEAAYRLNLKENMEVWISFKSVAVKFVPN